MKCMVVATIYMCNGSHYFPSNKDIQIKNSSFLSHLRSCMLCRLYLYISLYQKYVPLIEWSEANINYLLFHIFLNSCS